MDFQVRIIMATQQEVYTPKGHLEVWKIFRDNTKELVFSDSNTITSGMGVGLATMFAGPPFGSNHIQDYQIRWAQIGTSAPVSYGPTIYKLVAPLSSLSQYGTNTESIVSAMTPIENGAVGSTKYFIEVPFNAIQKVSNKSVRWTIGLGYNTANDLSLNLNEIGLFMHNPLNQGTTCPLLVAYKTFSNIEKTSDFALVFRWTITF